MNENSMSSIWNFLYDLDRSNNECKDKVQVLIDNGADITADDNCAVRGAAGNGKIEMVRFLIEHGADITANDNCAVRSAARDGKIE